MKLRNLSGKRIKLARVAADMKQVEVRAALSVDYDIHITQTGLSDIENGRRMVSDIELDTFAKLFDLNPLWFLYGDNLPDFTNTHLKSE